MDLDQITLQLAQKKMDTAPSSSAIHRPRFGTGGKFADVFFWDTIFTCQWAKYFPDQLPVHTSLDNLYRSAEPDGYIARQILALGEAKYLPSHPKGFSPPLLSWVELDLYRLHGDRERLERVYAPLRRYHDATWERSRLPNGLFYSDPYGCGMDNLPRWPAGWEGDAEGQKLTPEDVHPSIDVVERKSVARRRGLRCSWNRQGTYIDSSAQAALDTLCLRQIAEILGDEESSRRYRDQHAEITSLINELCWSEADGFYFDLAGSEQIRRFHIGAFWVLIADACPPNRLAPFIAKLTDPDHFGRETPVPSLSASNPEYRSEGDYWRGSSWAPTTYMVLRGLQVQGKGDLARKLAEQFLDTVLAVLNESGTLWENYAPDAQQPGNISQPDFVGWTGLATVAIPREIIQGSGD